MELKDLSPEDLIETADRLNDLGKNDLALEVVNKALTHRDVTPYDLMRAAQALERLPDSDLKTKAQQKITF